MLSPPKTGNKAKISTAHSHPTVLGLLASTIARQGNKKHVYGKGRKRNVCIFRRHDRNSTEYTYKLLELKIEFSKLYDIG